MESYTKIYNVLIWSGRWSTITPTTAKALVVLLATERPGKLLSMSLRTLSRYAGISRRAAMRAIADLEDQGYIQRIGTPGKRNIYRVLIGEDTMKDLHGEPSLKHQGRARNLTENRARADTPEGQSEITYLRRHIPNDKQLRWVLGMYPLQYAHRKMVEVVRGNGHVRNRTGLFLSACRSNFSLAPPKN